MFSSSIALLTALCSFLLPGCAEPAPPGDHVVSSCTWSYFGDPRALTIGNTLFTGCVARGGAPVVEAFDLETGARRVSRPFGRLEADDHNNPSLVAFRGRIFTFSSPHSGYLWPRDRQSAMRYRSTARPWARGGGWSEMRTVPIGAGCGLGYTYPNPVVAGDRLYLFMRGPCWEPYVTWTDDGVHWSRARTLVRAPVGPTARRIRPYAKYAAAPDGSILMLFSDGHPASWESGLYFARFADGRFLSAAGEVLGDLDQGPPAVTDLEQIHAPRDGRAWPMDIAQGPGGDPVAVYTSLRGVNDTFRYARFDAGAWETHPIAAAGRTLFGYHNAGATLDHADPSRVVLSRTIAGQNEIELRTTEDSGRTWIAQALTRDSDEFNVRPVIPRSTGAAGRGVVLYVTGSATSYRRYDTSVVVRRDPRLR